MRTPLDRLADWPRLPLAAVPTPLVPADRLATELDPDGLDLWVKLDAETGFALGGNKVRKLEFELEPTRLEGVTHLLTAGGPQSNHCRVTAAAAARLGLGCVLVLNGPEPEHPTGNALLHRLFGARIVTVDDRTERSSRMEETAAELRAAGHEPRVIPIGASTGLGSLGYVRAAVELFAQLDAIPGPSRPTLVFVPSSSCGTLAGLVLGRALAGRHDVTLVGVSADATEADILSDTLRIATDGAALLEWDGIVGAEGVLASDRQVGEGYGIPTVASHEATRLFATRAGLVLDPTYTSKGAAELIAWVGEKRIPRGARVVFLHTGGAPGLLA